MNRLHKIPSWLSIPGLILIIICLVLIFKPESDSYKLNSEETLKLMNDKSLQVDLNDIQGKQLIDVRSAEEYYRGHADQAMNIPVRQLLDKESLLLFDNLLHNGKEVVLYGANELEVTAPLFFLQQMGYKNTRMWAGGFTPAKGFTPDNAASSEVPLITSTSMQVVKEKTSPDKAEKPKRTSLIPVRKKASSGGGC
jgi:rhodanese-related sulfurtransferase